MWMERADRAQQALADQYWNRGERLFNNQAPCSGGLCNQPFHYWWQAHAADVLIDGYVRAEVPEYRERLADLYDGIVRRNGGTLLIEFYDDMEWLALASLRAFAATRADRYRRAVLMLWEEIQTGWNDEQGGGIAWQKNQPAYKNTPANAPAVILAARLFREFERPTDLEWAQRIFEWQIENLVDPDTGFVWDGKNRDGGGRIDKDWEFTYCQGVVIGAGIELYRSTGDRSYFEQALRTAHAATDRLVGSGTGILSSETTSDADGDAGLFKGIYVRFLAELVLEDPSQMATLDFLQVNGARLWEEGTNRDRILFSHSWACPPEEPVSLSVQLSGVMLTEQLARLEREGRLPANDQARNRINVDVGEGRAAR